MYVCYAISTQYMAIWNCARTSKLSCVEPCARTAIANEMEKVRVSNCTLVRKVTYGRT